MLDSKRWSSAKSLVILVGALTILANPLFLGPSFAGPLQNKIMTLTYHQAFTQFLDDTTWIYHDGSVGTLVVQLDGGSNAASIWHPNSATLVTGRWGGGTLSSARPDLAVFCLYLGRGVAVLPTADNVGITPDNRSRCYYLINFSRGVSDVLDGDPFRLRGARQAPAVLSGTRRYDARALMQMVGGDPSALRRAAY